MKIKLSLEERMGGKISVKARLIDSDGHCCAESYLFSINSVGTLSRCGNVNRQFGFDLNYDGRIKFYGE